MQTRQPAVLVENQQLPNAYPVVGSAQYTSTAGVTTFNSFSLNNTSASPVTVSISIVPSGGTQANANEIVTNLSVPAAGAAPTQVAALIGQHMAQDSVLLMKANAATAITPRVSGYVTSGS